MFSVICPTMWKSPAIQIMLPMMLEHNLVGEVILIDNDRANRPASIKPHPKLIIKDFGRNIYVNPAWNAGVREAKHEKLSLVSDDIIFHTTIFDQMVNYVNDRNGLFGLSHTCSVGTEGTIKPKQIEFERAEQWYPKDCHYYGMLMFLHKTGYKYIPDELKIFYGDTWLYAFNDVTRKKTNRYISNLDVINTVSTTSRRPEFKPIVHSDIENRVPVFQKEFGNTFNF